MSCTRFRGWLPVLGLALMAALPLQAQIGSTVANWPVPGASGSARASAKTATGDITDAIPFVGVTPCRTVDTRGSAGPYGGPALAAGTPRNFALQAGPCAGLPSPVRAYSLNITVTNTQGPGFILAYPQGSPQPVVSTLNYVAGQTVANAAIVPAGFGVGNGVTLVAGVSGTDVIIDINGYFTDQLNDGRAWRVLGNTHSDLFSSVNFNTGLAFSIVAQSNGATDSSAGIVGLSAANSGKTWGVDGFSSSDSPGAAGVFGGDSGGPTLAGSTLVAGVWGVSLSGYGVIGVSTVDGVKGAFIDSSGNALSAGHLGHDGTNGVYASGNIAATGAKTFVEPHPLLAGKAIVYVALEGPEAGTYFRGRGSIRGGTGTIQVPESFRMVSDEEGLTVQITPIGETVPVAVVSADLNAIVVRSDAKNLDFYYVVNGVRQAFKDWDPMGQPDYFVPESLDATMPESLSPEQKRRLVANGTYNADGTVNRTTAEKAGWTQAWADRDAAARAARSAAAAEARILREGP